MTDRLADTARFYGLLGELEARVGGARVLTDCNGYMNWPERGVYFFREIGETRNGSESSARVTRVGTHALTAKSRSTLWGRLSQHRGAARTGAGNHRGSIFRLLAGIALARRDNIDLPPSWGVGGDPGEAARRLIMGRNDVVQAEAELEALVSDHIGAMPFLWLSVGDAPGPASERGFIERNAIALLSGYRGSATDSPSPNWLGRHSDRDRVRLSGLWNNNHVDDTWDSSFLDAMERRTEETGRV